jgi:hypothetical protein
MSLTREQILEYAHRYTPETAGNDFPYNGDLFCFFERTIGEIPEKQNTQSRWKFGGYAVCLKYTLDEDSRPEGKWIWLHYIGLATFPPIRQVLKLQPPHAVLGEFQNADRTMEIRIVKMPIEDIPSPATKDNLSIFRNPHNKTSSYNIEEVNNQNHNFKSEKATQADKNRENSPPENILPKTGKILQFPSRKPASQSDDIPA